MLFETVAQLVLPRTFNPLIAGSNPARLIRENVMDKGYVCPGCHRPELHKMCPAWGTPIFMTGKLFTAEDEVKYAEMREKAIEESRQKGKENPEELQ